MASIGETAADIEAPVNATHVRSGRQERATATMEGPAPVGTDPVNPDAAAASSPRLHLWLERANLPFLALAVTATVALLFIVSDIIVNHTIHPASTGVFLLLSLCWVIFKRHNPERSSEDGSGRPTTLTKEAREELLTYFVFPGLETGTGAQTGPEARGAGDAHHQQQQQPKGDETASGRDVLQESRTSNRSGRSSTTSGKERSTGSKGWRWTASDGGEVGARVRDNSSDTDDTDDTDNSGSFPARTAGPYPRPPSPCPPPLPVPSEQRFDLGGSSGFSCVRASTASGEVAAGAAAGVVTRVVREMLEEEKEKERQEETVDGGIESRDDEQPRRGRSAPFDGRDSAVETAAVAGGTEASAVSTTAAACGTARAPPGTTNDEHRGAATTLPEGAAAAAAAGETPRRPTPATTTPAEPATEPGTAPVSGNQGSAVGHSDSGEWSTDRACIVCFGDYAPGELLCRLPCRHVYHAECINEWLDRAKVPCCPLCKTDLLLTNPADAASAAPAARSGAGAAVQGAGLTTGENAV